MAAFFSFVLVTIVDLGVVFWVGAQLWYTFVSQLTDIEDQEQLTIERQMERRFERNFALPTLLSLLLANIGLLVANGQSGPYWIMREIVIILAIVVAAYTAFSKRLSQSIASTIPWINLLLGLALLIAVTLSGHAAAVSADLLVYAVLVDWLHLLAAALWVGGLFFIVLIYLPLLKDHSLSERASSLLTILPRFTPLAITSIIIMAVSGPFNAAVQMNSIGDVTSTAYGRTLVVKALLVGLLLFLSAMHIWLFRPRLEKAYTKYSLARDSAPSGDIDVAEQPERPLHRSDEVKQLETQVATQAGRLTSTLRWESLLGVGILLCTGLLSIFGGTLQTAAPLVQPPPAAAKPRPFVATARTSDNKYSIELNVNPNTFGTNVFTVTVRDSATGKVDTNVSVSISTTMLDMNMGTQVINLQPDGKGHFSAQGDLSMGGHWQLRIVIRAPGNTLHEAKVDMLTPP
jgi:copper transport protein